MRGPAEAKLLRPKVLRVLGTASVLLEDEWRKRRPCSETSRLWAGRYGTRSADVRYVGAFEASDWCTSQAILNFTRLWTSSQSSWRNILNDWNEVEINGADLSTHIPAVFSAPIRACCIPSLPPWHRLCPFRVAVRLSIHHSDVM